MWFLVALAGASLLLGMRKSSKSSSDEMLDEVNRYLERRRRGRR